ncbi:NAD(P)-dependent oxidoreductase [Candidatus Daviesbacteria bacterium]|nr:NAD(P)-dependent oxidoreductase [Candidatus Daviesbacteria bacterium]
MAKLRIGFIGLGLMGGPMAKNIHKAGFHLTVYNRSPNRLKDFKKLKDINIAKSPKEVAEHSDVVITCVTAPKDVKQVMLGKAGVIEGAGNPSTRSARSGLVAIDMSTIGPTAAREIGKGLNKKGVEFLDAPITGGTAGAQAGTLTIFIGGDKKVFEKVKRVLEAMGKHLHYMGSQGLGQAIKLIGNQIAATSIEAIAEGMLLADKLGLKRQQVMDALSTATLTSPNMLLRMPNMVKGRYEVSFSLANMRKDLKLAVDEAAKEDPKKFPTLIINENLLKKGMDMDLSEKDYSAVLTVLMQNK